MFYRSTNWAERYAASQAAQHMPGSRRQQPYRFLNYGRKDFDSGVDFFWFYTHYFIFSLGCLLTLGIVVLDIGLYLRPPKGRPRPDWRPLVLSLLPVSLYQFREKKIVFHTLFHTIRASI